VLVIISLFIDLPQYIQTLWHTFQEKPAAFVYVFPELEGNLDEKYKSSNFTGETLDEIKASFRKPLNLNGRCPCGSGKKYGECHPPTTDSNGWNLWRGPGYSQAFVFGYREPLNGVYFEKKKRGDIIVLKGDVKVSLCKYFTMDYSILLSKAIVQSLTVSEGNGKIIFSGVLNVQVGANSGVQVLIGTPSSDFVTDFVAKTGGKTTSHERGHWAGFIGEPVNPMEGILNHRWYRYFLAKGFLIEFQPGNQLIFKMSKKIEPVNTFTLSLPFNKIDLTYPKIVTESKFSKVSIEVERENIYWNLFLYHGQFAEDSKRQKDSLFMEGIAKTEDLGERYDGIRQSFLGPRKIRICLANPE